MLRQRLKARPEVPVIGGSIPPLAIYLTLNALRRFSGIDLYWKFAIYPLYRHYVLHTCYGNPSEESPVIPPFFDSLVRVSTFASRFLNSSNSFRYVIRGEIDFPGTLTRSELIPSEGWHPPRERDPTGIQARPSSAFLRREAPHGKTLIESLTTETKPVKLVQLPKLT